MQGYRVSDQDVKAMVRWLQVNHPENGNSEFAREMLVGLKLNYRQTGWADPDKLEDYYQEFVNRLQNGRISEE